jgi:hypothetical protein
MIARSDRVVPPSDMLLGGRSALLLPQSGSTAPTMRHDGHCLGRKGRAAFAFVPIRTAFLGGSRWVSNR